MFLSIEKTGKLNQFSDIDTFEIGEWDFFISGKIEGMITEKLSLLPKNFEDVCIEMTEIIKKNNDTNTKKLKEYFSRLCGEYALFIFKDGFFRYLVTDQSAYSRVYYYTGDDFIYFSGNYSPLCQSHITN
jgi:hypothetical protein